MGFKNYTYLLLILGLLIVPLAFTFNNRVRFYTKFKYLFPAIFFSGAIFLLWDIRFTGLKIWTFNPEFLIGANIYGVPVEEWLFYFAVPYSALFLYETLVVKFPDFEKSNLFLAISLVLFVAFGLTAYFARQKVYTFFTFFLLTIYFGYTIFRNRFKRHYTMFYLTWLIFLIPFFIVKLVLTGLPVVEYDDMFNLGVLIFTIPIEDFFCFFLLLLMNVTIYEYFRKQQSF